MFRTFAVPCAVALWGLALTAAAGDKKPTLADDLKALQGLWQSPVQADKKNVRLLIMGDRVGYTVKRGDDLFNFTALLPARHKEENGKRFFEIEVAKDTVYRVDYRFEKGALTVTVAGGDYKVDRVNTRAPDSPEAKKLVGTWKITGGTVGGKEVPPKELGLAELVFTEDRYAFKDAKGKEMLNAFFRVDPKAKVGTVLRIFEAGSAQAKATQSVTLGS